MMIRSVVSSQRQSVTGLFYSLQYGYSDGIGSSFIVPFHRSTIRQQQQYQYQSFTTSSTTRNAAVSESSSIGTIGFIGLGNMGLPMAINIQNKIDRSSSTELFVYDTNPTVLDIAKSKHNLQVSTTIPSMVESILSKSSNSTKQDTILITMVPNDTVVDKIMNELTQLIPAKTDTNTSKFIIVDSSTVHPSTSRKWNTEWETHGHSFFDAPVSGGVAGAVAGTLTFMVGAASTDPSAAIIQPYLEYMGRRIIPCGAPGNGAVVKLCNNLALASQMAGICEAFVLGDRLGVDPNIIADVITVSTAKCWSNDINNPHPTVAERNASPASNNYNGGFSTTLLLKDLQLALQTASDNGLHHLPTTSLTAQLYKVLATNEGFGNKDFGILYQYLQDNTMNNNNGKK